MCVTLHTYRTHTCIYIYIIYIYIHTYTHISAYIRRTESHIQTHTLPQNDVADSSLGLYAMHYLWHFGFQHDVSMRLGWKESGDQLPKSRFS